MAGLDAVFNNPPRHSREDGNPEGGHQGSIDPVQSIFLVFSVHPYQGRGRLNQVRKDRIQSPLCHVPLRRGSVHLHFEIEQVSC